MAKKKSPGAKGKAASPPAAKKETRVTIMVLKGTPAYRDWLLAAATKKRLPIPVLFDQVMADWAERNGLAEPPPR